MKKIFGAMLLLSISCFAGAQNIPCLSGSLSSGIMAFYPFGSGSLNDESGNGHTLTNPTSAYPTADRFANPKCAYHFDRANGDYLEIAAGGSTFLDNMTTSPFSISLWYQPMGPRGTGDYELLIGRGKTTGLHCPDTWSEWSAGLYDCRRAVMGFDQYATWQGTMGMGCTSFMAAVTGNWHHLAFVYDGVTRNLYVDGILTTSLSGPCGPMSGNLGELMLGVDYTGDLDDVLIYKRALTPAEVNALQKNGACCGKNVTTGPCEVISGSLASGVMAFYPFGSGSLNDASGNGHTLTNPTSAYPTADRFANPKCAYHFDRVNGDYLEIAAGGSTFLDNMTTSPFSISLWYQPMGPRNPGDYELLAGRGFTTGLHCPDTWSEWSAGLYDCRRAVMGFDQYATWQGMMGMGCTSFMTAVTGNWHHLAFVYDGVNRNLYVDGVLTATMSGPCGPMSGNLGELMLGVDYTGDLDDIVIYNRALTVAEVTLLQNSGACCNDVITTGPCEIMSGSLATGVLTYYPFGSGSLFDASGNSHTLTNSTTAYPTADRFSNANCAYHFDRVNGDYLNIAAGGSTFLDNLTISPFSISLWYRPMGPRGTGDYELLLGRGMTTGLHCPDTWSEWSAGLYDCRRAVMGFDQFSTWQSTLGVSCSAFMTATTGSWHHLAFIYDGVNRNLYVDGMLTATASGPCGPMSGNVGDLMLGVDYTGDLDDVAIYNRALTAAEITALQNSGACCSVGSPKPSDVQGKNLGSNNDLLIHPNPSDGKVFISADMATIRSINVYSSSTGQLVATYNFNASEVSVDLDKLPVGMYLLKITTDTETVIRKVTKN